MSPRARASVLLLSLAAACGGAAPAETMRIAFARQPLMCTLPALQAKLQIAGLPDCPLQIDQDQSVSGTCGAIPTGVERDVKLLYFEMIGSDEVDLAQSILTLDLRSVTRTTYTLMFDASQVDIADFDDKHDGVPNIVKACQGKDPRAGH